MPLLSLTLLLQTCVACDEVSLLQVTRQVHRRQGDAQSSKTYIALNSTNGLLSFGREIATRASGYQAVRANSTDNHSNQSSRSEMIQSIGSFWGVISQEIGRLDKKLKPKETPELQSLLSLLLGVTVLTVILPGVCEFSLLFTPMVCRSCSTGVMINFAGLVLGALISFFIAKYEFLLQPGFNESVNAEKPENRKLLWVASKERHNFEYVFLFRYVPQLSLKFRNYVPALIDLDTPPSLLSVVIHSLTLSSLWTAFGDFVYELFYGGEFRILSFVAIFIAAGIHGLLHIYASSRYAARLMTDDGRVGTSNLALRDNNYFEHYVLSHAKEATIMAGNTPIILCQR